MKALIAFLVGTVACQTAQRAEPAPSPPPATSAPANPNAVSTPLHRVATWRNATADR